MTTTKTVFEMTKEELEQAYESDNTYGKYESMLAYYCDYASSMGDLECFDCKCHRDHDCEDDCYCPHSDTYQIILDDREALIFDLPVKTRIQHWQSDSGFCYAQAV